MEINYVVIVAKLLVVCGLSALIGYERETRKILTKGTAGLRTHMLVALGSTLLTLIALHGFQQFPNADPGRIISYIVMGIGFLGAGTIMSQKGKIVGLTTAASIWLVAAIGISVGLGLYIISLITTILSLIVLELWRFEKDLDE